MAILSIVAGEIENSMTNCRPLVKDDISVGLEKSSNTSHPTTEQKIDNDVDLTNTNLPIEPVLYWDLVHALYQKFESIIKSCCDVNILQTARLVEQTNQNEKAKQKTKMN